MRTYSLQEKILLYGPSWTRRCHMICQNAINSYVSGREPFQKVAYPGSSHTFHVSWYAVEKFGSFRPRKLPTIWKEGSLHGIPDKNTFLIQRAYTVRSLSCSFLTLRLTVSLRYLLCQILGRIIGQYSFCTSLN